MYILSTFSDNLNAFLKTNALFIALGIVTLIVVSLVLLIVLNRKKN